MKLVTTHHPYELNARVTATDRDGGRRMRPSDGHPKGCRGRRMRPRGICVRQRGTTEAYGEYAARTEEPRRVPTPSPQWGGMPQEAASRIEAVGRKYRPRCEQLLKLVILLLLTPPVWASELTELLELTYQNNLELKQAQAMVEREESLLVAGVTPDDPMLGFSTLERGGVTRYGVLSQKLRFPLKYYWQYQIHKHRIGGQKSHRHKKTFDVRGEVIALYYAIYSTQNIYRITEANVQTLKEFARIAEKKYASGQSSQGDSMKAHLELTRLELDLIQLRQEEEALQEKLKSIVNHRKFKGLSFAGKKLPVPQYRGREGIPLKDSPLLKKEFFLFQEAQAMNTNARWDFLPDIQLQYQWRLSGEPNDSRIYSAKIVFPLWFWKKGGRATAAASYRRAREHLYGHRELTLTAQINDLEGKVRANAKALKIYTTGLLPQARGAYNMAKAAYRANKTSFLNLLDSERSLYRVQTGFFRALASYAKSIAQLESVLGAKVSNLEGK